MSLGANQSLAKPGTGRHPASSRATSIHAISFLFWHIYLIVYSPIINSYLLAILQIPYYPPPATLILLPIKTLIKIPIVSILELQLISTNFNFHQLIKDLTSVF